MTSGKSTPVGFLDEGATTPRKMDVSEPLATAVARAAFVNVDQEPFAVSFNSLFLGLLATSDATGDWLRTQFDGSNQIEQARGALHEAETQVELGRQALEMAERDFKQKREMLAWNNYVRSIAPEKLVPGSAFADPTHGCAAPRRLVRHHQFGRPNIRKADPTVTALRTIAWGSSWRWIYYA